MVVVLLVFLATFNQHAVRHLSSFDLLNPCARVPNPVFPFFGCIHLISGQSKVSLKGFQRINKTMTVTDILWMVGKFCKALNGMIRFPERQIPRVSMTL